MKINKMLARSGLKKTNVRPIAKFILVSLGLVMSGVSQAQDGKSDVQPLEEVTVIGLKEKFGSGIGRAEYVVGAQDIEERPAGAEITQSLTKIPGVQVSTGDSRGGSFSNELYLRGLTDSQIGLSIDGIPGGDSRFNGGSPPNRYVESSNVSRIVVSQSAAEVGSPSNSALGGFIDFQTDNPRAEFGGDVELSFGGDNYNRAFLRLDSGEIAPGLTGYISYSDSSNEIYTGPNNRDRNREHLDFKILKEFDSGSSIVLRYSKNELDDNDFGIVSLADFQADPTSDTVNDFFSGDPDIDGNFTGFGGALGGTREDDLLYLNIDLQIAENISLSINPYTHDLKGESFAYQDDSQVTASGDPRDQNVDGVDFIDGVRVADLRVTPRDRERSGVTAELKFDNVLNNHDVRVGFWVEDDESNEDRNFFRVNDASRGITFSRSSLNYIEYERDVKTDTTYLYIQDHITLLDGQLELDIGLTKHDVDYNYGSPIEYAGRRHLNAKTDGVDIKLGGVYHFTDDLEVFAGFSENFGGIFEDVFLGSSSAIDPNSIGAETSDNIDLGIRYVTDTLAFSAQYYEIDFSNRLTIAPNEISAENIENVINGNASTQVTNLGGIDSTGIELTAALTVGDFDLYASYSHQTSEWQSDDPSQGIVRGVQTHDIPEDSLYAEVKWNASDKLEIAFNAKYIGDRVGANIFVPDFCNRFFCFDENGSGLNGGDYIGTQEIPTYWVAGLRGSYEIGDILGMNNVKVQINIDNLFDEEYIASVTGATTTLPEFGFIGGIDATFSLDRYFIGAPRTATLTIGGSF